MKKSCLFFLTLISLNTQAVAATSLLQVYEQALMSDPIFQQAIAQRLANKEAVPLNLAPLLPQANIVGAPFINKLHIAGANGLPASSFDIRGYSVTLSVSQTVFNYAQFAAFAGAKAVSKQADASLNAAAQSLMLRVSQAYFTVLKDEDFLRFNAVNRKAYAKQLDQINQEYKAGIKTQTDLYTAESAYDSANASYITAETTLQNDKENLRAITGIYYPNLARLSEKFPLISPHPNNMEAWVHTAQLQNWSIRAALYANQVASENVKQQFAGHFPTVNLEGSYNLSYDNSLAGASFSSPPVAGTTVTTAGTFEPVRAHASDAMISLNLNVPIFEGGTVVAQTRQAKYQYRVASEQLEQTVRATMNTTRQSYLGILAGIKQIEADKQAIKSTYFSMTGLQEGYHVGTQTLVDVINQQQKVFQASTQYATDRYAYVYNLLLLKQATGTLSQNDLMAINAWLLDDNDVDTSCCKPQIKKLVQKKLSHSHQS